MSGHTIRLALPASPSEVFPFLIQPELQQQWMGGLVSTRRLCSGPLVVGARMEDVIAAAGQRLTFQTTVTRIEAPHRYEAEMVTKGVEIEARYHLKPDDDGTLLRYDADTRFTTFAMRLLAGTIEKKARESLDADFERLRALFV